MIAFRTHRRKLLLGASCTTYLCLAVWLGPHAALNWVIFIACLVGYWKLCKRFPFLILCTLWFFEGLCGVRSGYYYGPYYTTRRRRH